ncbi:MAG TPA: DUF2156 domain-containing protein [Candidatus Dormibacteraeota bacterium]|nr:DUF2156 domain-containing protein [Candidatus Dormibacteraeota bacterium]
MKPRFPLPQTPWLAAVGRPVLMFVALADGLLSLELWTLRSPHARSAATTVLQAVAPVRPLVALALAGSALYLATRPKRAFWRILLVLALAATLLAMKSGHGILFAVALIDGILALLAGSLWSEEGDRLWSRLGWSLLAVAIATLGADAWLFNEQRGPHMVPAFALPLLLGFAAGVLGLILLDRSPPMPGAWDPATLPLYISGGRSAVSPFALMRDKRHFWASDRSSFLAFACRTGVALAIGPAIGPARASTFVYQEFRSACRARGWRPALYQVPAATLSELPGTRRVMIGSEALVDVDAFGLKGRAMASLRHQVTRAQRCGVSVEIVPESKVPWAVRSAMRQLALDVVSRSPLGEMSFSVGSREEPPLVERTVGLAFEGEGQLAGYVTWLWVPAAEMFVLDEVKRSPQARAGTTELLIATSLMEFRGKARRASLGLAPLTHARHAAGLAVLESFLVKVLRVRSVSPGLYAFKAKFEPAWEPRYLVVEAMADLAPVLLALLLVHYPGLTRRWLSWSRGMLPLS